MRWRKAAAALATVLALLLIGLWTQRKPIARDYVDRALRARGVPVRYVIAELGPGRQRLTGVVIGDPAMPDLTAETVELRIGYGLGWPTVRAVAARGVRLRGRLAGGTLSFGAVDRLLPKAGDGPIRLPDLNANLADVRIRLATPAGAVELTVAGNGNLANGFAGRVTAAAARLASGGCIVDRAVAAFATTVSGGRPTLIGPTRMARIACDGVRAGPARLDLAATLSPALAPERARLRFVGGPIGGGMLSAAGLRGGLTFDGRDERAGRGGFGIVAEGVAAGGDHVRAIALNGTYRVAGSPVRAIEARGEAMARGVMLAPARMRGLADVVAAVAGTPIAPLAAVLAAAAARAGRDADVRARGAFQGTFRDKSSALRGEATVASGEIAARSGARLAFGGGGAGAGFDIGGVRSGIVLARLDGTVTADGGGLPALRIALRQPEAFGTLAGEMTMAPYAAGGARLALTPVRFARARGGVLRVATLATLDGPLGDGRVTGLALPIDARLGEALVVNLGCVPLSFARLSLAGVDLGATRLPLCPVGGAMLRVADGAIGGGVAVPRPRLTGRIGTQPLTIVARDLRVALGTPGFVADALAVRLGTGEAATRLDVARLDGAIGGGGIGGRFAGAAGRIANVPLLLSRGDGRWRLASGRLALAGGLTVADADAAPRFTPLVSQNVTLDLTGGVIRAGGTLREPRSGLAITAVSLTHDLAKGTGGATLDVPGITFGPAFQPDALTRLTVGVVANVAGAVRGQGRIDWSPGGATSTGDFATDGIDLAAVFGPVTGIKGVIHFADLLALETPPGQLVTVAAFNPGIAVEGGVIGYQLLPGQKVAVGGGKWPFFGGALILEPTVLDFGRPVERRMTFRVEGLDAARFIEQFDFKNIAATGAFDGVLPMIFDDKGGRIDGGRLTVRRGGGTLAYVGELTNKDLGTFGKLAFDALKAIRYDNLGVELDGALDGEIVSRIVFTGVNENPAAGDESKGLLKNLTGLPFKFNIVVKAPFRGLTSSASAFVNPGGLIAGAARPAAPTTPAAPAVQPPLSEDKR